VITKQDLKDKIEYIPIT